MTTFILKTESGMLFDQWRFQKHLLDRLYLTVIIDLHNKEHVNSELPGKVYCGY